MVKFVKRVVSSSLSGTDSSAPSLKNNIGKQMNKSNTTQLHINVYLYSYKFVSSVAKLALKPYPKPTVVCRKLWVCEPCVQKLPWRSGRFHALCKAFIPKIMRRFAADCINATNHETHKTNGLMWSIYCN